MGHKQPRSSEVCETRMDGGVCDFSTIHFFISIASLKKKHIFHGFYDFISRNKLRRIFRSILVFVVVVIIFFQLGSQFQLFVA